VDVGVEPKGAEVTEGRLFTIEVERAGSRTWLGPAWAVVCGTVASGGLALEWRVPVLLLLGVLLADSVLGSVWRLVVEGEPKSGRRTGSGSKPVSGSVAPALPFSLPESLEKRLSDCRRTFSTHAGTRVLGLGFLSVFALLIGAILGNVAVLLTVAALLVAAARLAVSERHGVLPGLLASVYLAGLPWLMGFAAFGHLQWGAEGKRALAQALILAAVYAVTFHAYRLLGGQLLSRGATVLSLAQVGAVVVLVVAREPILAGAVGLLLLPQLMLQPALLKVGEGVWYLQRVQVFTLLATLVTAAAMVA
jgi:hypothetical protein